MTGFVAGILVHTDKGLVPIQEIKVGDWVLSRQIGTGSTEYKQVVNTFKSDVKRPVMSPFAIVQILYGGASILGERSWLGTCKSN